MVHCILWGHALLSLCLPEPDTTADTVTWSPSPSPLATPEREFAVLTSAALPRVLLSTLVTMPLTLISLYLISASAKRSAMLLLAVTTAC